MLVRAPGSADTVQIVFVFSRQIKIDDCFHVIDVDAARRHVRRNQNREFSAPEVVHDHIALALLHVAVDALRLIAFLFEALGQPVGHKLRVTENHDALVDIRIQQIQQMVNLLVLFGRNDILRNLRPILLRRFDGNFNRVMLIFPRNRQHILIRRRGEQHHLPLVRRRLDDARHVLDKAHVEHLVRFVQHHRVDGIQMDVAAVHVVQQPTGGCDENLRFALECGKLLGNRLSAVEHSNAAALDVLGQFGQFIPDLQRQFAGWRKHHFLNFRFIKLHIFEHRNAERAGFARAGWCDCVHVRAGHHQRNRLRLHGRWRREPHVLDGAQHFFGQIHLFKRGGKLVRFGQNLLLPGFTHGIRESPCSADLGRTCCRGRECLPISGQLHPLCSQ